MRRARLDATARRLNSAYLPPSLSACLPTCPLALHTVNPRLSPFVPPQLYESCRAAPYNSTSQPRNISPSKEMLVPYAGEKVLPGRTLHDTMRLLSALMRAWSPSAVMQSIKREIEL